MKQRREWSEAEIVVLSAIFVSLGFSAGDDERPECKRIAAAFGRTGGTIDRQWRNIKDYLANMECAKVGGSVKYWSDVALADPSLIKNLAKHYCEIREWPLADLLERENGHR
jgi:hypothetical protein